MSEQTSAEVNTNNQSSASLLQQIEGEINKANREALKAKLKDLVKKRHDAEKVVNSITLEINKMIADFQAGIL